MTSSDDLPTYEPWLTSAYADSWLTEAFARDAETLTRALQKTISSDNTSSFYKPDHQQHTPSASGLSGSDPEMAAASAPRRPAPSSATKKITKRKPRPTRKCQTTFIMADPANFRQMVQQVTGVRLETLQQQQQQQPLIVKPEPKRLTGTGISLPTLDTSSFFVNGQQQQERVVSGHAAYGDSLIDSGGPGPGCGYEPYQSFPTLESWKVICDS